MFEAARDITSKEIRAYREFVSISLASGCDGATYSTKPFHPCSGIPRMIPFSRLRTPVEQYRMGDAISYGVMLLPSDAAFNLSYQAH